MKISAAPGNSPFGSDSRTGSFAEAMHKENPAVIASRLSLAAAKSFHAGDIAASFSWLLLDFVPSSGEGMLDAIALGEGVTKEMRRYEEKDMRRYEENAE